MTPAGAANREHEQMMADIRMLQEQNQRLQVALTALNETLKALNTKLDDQGAATRKGFADQKLLIDGATGDLRVLREKLDETNVRLTSLSQDVDGLRDLVHQASQAPPAVPGTTDATRTDHATDDHTGHDRSAANRGRGHRDDAPPSLRNGLRRLHRRPMVARRAGVRDLPQDLPEIRSRRRCAGTTSARP